MASKNHKSAAYDQIDLDAIADENQNKDKDPWIGYDLYKNALGGFEKMRREEILCDYTIVVQGKRFKVHKTLLAAISDYFRSMFTGGMLEARQDYVELKDTSLTGVEVLLDFIYTGELQVTLETVADILATASLIQVKDALSVCESFLSSELDHNNCVDILNIADVYNLDATSKWCSTFILANFERIAKTEEFNKMTVEQLEPIVQSEELKIDSELNLFYDIMLWIAYNRREREKYAARLLQHVRFGLISAEDLIDEIKAHSIMTTNEDCHKYLEEAFLYHLVPLRQPIAVMQTKRTCVRGHTALIAHDTNSNSRQYQLNEIKPEFMLDWNELPKSELTVASASMCTYNNFLFICGGKKTESADPNNIVKMYNPAVNKWLELPSLQEARGSFPLIVVDDYLYAIGGETFDSICTDTVEKYSIEKSRWEYVKSLPESLISHAAVACKSKIYVTGGYNMSIQRQSAMYCYDPRLDKWDTLEPMMKVRSRHTMCSDNEQNIFIIDCMSDHIENYDVRTKQWHLLDRNDLSAIGIHLPMRECRIVANLTHVYFISVQDDDNTDHVNFKLDLKKMKISKFAPYPGFDTKPFCFFMKLPQTIIKVREIGEIL